MICTLRPTTTFVLLRSLGYRLQRTHSVSREEYMTSLDNPVPLPATERAEELKEALTEIRSRVQNAAAPTSHPTLVAVSKYKPASDILACYQQGQYDFGENYVQELVDKASVLPREIRWHFIGTLQSNKAKILASIPNLYCVQTLASIKGASALNKAVPDDRDTPLGVLLQVNTSDEDSKSGLAPLDTGAEVGPSDLGALATYIVKECPRLRLEGLMTIGALEQSLNASDMEKNSDFEKLKEIRDKLTKYLTSEHGDSPWGHAASGRLVLSMGMSSDFEAALKAESDLVRIGTGIFGQRSKKAT